jgi:hypothetical protein
MSAPTTIQTLTLQLGTTQYECQLTGATLEPNYSDKSVTTFCGTFSTSNESFTLTLAGLQDWGSVTGLCDMLWEAADAGENLQFTLEVGGVTFTGTVPGRKTPAGGTAGDALTFSISLPVQGKVTRTVAAGTQSATTSS